MYNKRKNIIFNTIANRPFGLIDNIAYFVSEKEPDSNIEWADGLISGNWVERTWNEHFNLKIDVSVLASLCRELGIYLEFSTYIRYCYKNKYEKDIRN